MTNAPTSQTNDDGSDQKLTVLIRSADGHEHRLEASRRTWTRQQALQKAALWWGACWALAAVCLFIPIVHFVATPLAFLAGPMIGILMYKLHNGKSDLIVGNATCPSCRRPLQLATSAERWPIADNCLNCNNRVTAAVEERHPGR